MLKTPEDSTPINDLSGLIPSGITVKSALDEWEAENILKAYNRYLKTSRKRAISPGLITAVHKEMFGLTWKWAGSFRKENLNLGVEWFAIPVEIKKLCDDIAFWEKSKNVNILEQSVRIHHRLVRIHPFLNGNGRHARMIADIFLSGRGKKLPLWPDKDMVETTDIRKRYIHCLKEADNGDYAGLLEFTEKLVL